MGAARCKALYKQPMQERAVRAWVELDCDTLVLAISDTVSRRLHLSGATFEVRDATSAQKFVRHLRVNLATEFVDLITPPDEGSIAPRAARLPTAPVGATIIERSAFEAVASWLQGSGRLAGRTVAELAALACIATSQFASAIGEWAAQVAAEMASQRTGPMRGGADFRSSLRPLELAARRSPRASEALAAAFSLGSVLHPAMQYLP